MSDPINAQDVPGLGTVHFLNTAAAPLSGVGEGRPVQVIWPDGSDLSREETATAERFWQAHPELH